jgi:hypothetical protein
MTDTNLEFSLRRSARIAAKQESNKHRKLTQVVQKTFTPTNNYVNYPYNQRPQIPTLDEFVALRRDKLSLIQDRPLIILLKKLKEIVVKNPYVEKFYKKVILWIFNISVSSHPTPNHVEVEIWPEEKPYIVGFIRVLKAIDPTIVPEVTRFKDPNYPHMEANYMIKFDYDPTSPNFDNSVLDSDHLFPEWPLCRPGFDIMEAEWTP